MFYLDDETLNWIKNKEKRGYAGDISMGYLIRIYEKHCSAQTEPAFFQVNILIYL